MLISLELASVSATMDITMDPLDLRQSTDYSVLANAPHVTMGIIILA